MTQNFGWEALGDTPSLDLRNDQITTISDLISYGSAKARPFVTPGMTEDQLTRLVVKSMRIARSEWGLTALEIRSQDELLSGDETDSGIMGRLDISVKFLEQFGNEEDYVAVECKKVDARDLSLSSKYVSHGIARFADEQYSYAQTCGFMLGYVLGLPVDQVVSSVQGALTRRYGSECKLSEIDRTETSLSVHEGLVPRTSRSPIRLRHIMVDMTPAARQINQPPH